MYCNSGKTLEAAEIQLRHVKLLVDADTFLGKGNKACLQKYVLHGIYTWSSPIQSCTKNRMLCRIFVFADLYNAELENSRQHKTEQRSPSSIILWPDRRDGQLSTNLTPRHGTAALIRALSSIPEHIFNMHGALSFRHIFYTPLDLVRVSLQQLEALAGMLPAGEEVKPLRMTSTKPLPMKGLHCINISMQFYCGRNKLQLNLCSGSLFRVSTLLSYST